MAIALAVDSEREFLAILDREAGREGSAQGDIRDRWMWLAVASLYEHRTRFEDPWTQIEDIWEAFDHAPALNGLIRWMPAPPGEKLGMDAMLERWRAYVLAGPAHG